LIERMDLTHKPLILSTGMSTLGEITLALSAMRKSWNSILLHCCSGYPSKDSDLNLRCIPSLYREYQGLIGYSGHEIGLATTLAAVAMGACMVERHFTLDRSMWGSDQSASIEPHAMARLVRDIRAIESAMGDGVKRVLPCEEAARAKLRRVQHV